MTDGTVMNSKEQEGIFGTFQQCDGFSRGTPHEQ